jgi:putative ABC transport system ATP-binding protein
VSVHGHKQPGVQADPSNGNDHKPRQQPEEGAMNEYAVTNGAAAARAVTVTKRYGKGGRAVTALDQVSVSFARGGFTAVMGPSGSGKSTLMHCVAGLDGVDSGQVFIGETELGTLSDYQRTVLRRDRVGFVFQAFNLLPALTAEENITLPMLLARNKPDPAWFGEVMGTLGLAGRRSHRPAELSGGEQQRVAVARALAARPEVIFADEPTGNLDSRASAELLSFLRRAVTELGQTIVMVTHDARAASAAQTAVFLADGKIVGELASPEPDTVLDRLKSLTA